MWSILGRSHGVLLGYTSTWPKGKSDRPWGTAAHADTGRRVTRTVVLMSVPDHSTGSFYLQGHLTWQEAGKGSSSISGPWVAFLYIGMGVFESKVKGITQSLMHSCVL